MILNVFLSLGFKNEMSEQPITAEQEDKRMENVFKDYLEMDTSYALLMNGPRGIGKTFFVKEKVIPLIKTVAVKDDQQKKYLPVYISLFGIKSIDEVYTLLALELIPVFKNKNVKVGLAITKLITRGVLNFKGGGDINNYLKDLNDTSKTLVDTKDFVLLFDDLDRISKSLEVGEVIGFINSLVEHENNKVIVIADDEQFNKDANYIAVKEKTIGTIIEYLASMCDNYDAIVGSKYKQTYAAYYEYLVSEKEDILHWFAMTETKNLRTLIYFLQRFHTIFSNLFIELELQKEDAGGLGHKKLNAILRFALAVCIEFKKGELSYQKARGIDDSKAINLQISRQSLKEALADNLRSLQSNAPGPPTPSYRERFIEIYFDSGYEFYPQVFNFITGGDTFRVKPLVQQLKRNFDDKIYKPKPQDVVFEKLSDPAVYDLTNEAYIRLTDQMLALAKKCVYPLDRYIAILYYCQRFPEIKKYNISVEAYTLIDEIKAHPGKFTYDGDLRNKFDDRHRYKDDQEFQDLWKALNEVNNSVRLSQIEKNRADLFLEFRDDPDQFYLKVRELPDVPILASWDFEKFYTHFKAMPASAIQRFTRFMKKRYEYQIREKVEYFFLCALFDEVQKINPDEPKNLRRIALDKLGAVLSEVIERNHMLKIKVAMPGQ